MSADVACDQLQSGVSQRQQLLAENARLREQSRRLFQRTWQEVGLHEGTLFLTRLNLAQSREQLARLHTGKHPLVSAGFLPPRFVPAQAVCLDHEFEPADWLYGIVISHRWHDAELSARGDMRPAGWSYAVQFGDPLNLFEEWIDEEHLCPITPTVAWCSLIGDLSPLGSPKKCFISPPENNTLK